MEQNLNETKTFDITQSKIDRNLLIKFFMAILVTNAMTYLITLPNKPTVSITKKGFKRITLRLINYAGMEHAKQKVIIIDKNFNLISKKAKIVKKVSPAGPSSPPSFMIEIEDENIIKAIGGETIGLLAYPSTRVDLLKKTSRKRRKRKQSYELKI